MLLIADPEQEARPPAALYRDLYGFTPTETRLAAALLPGAELRRAAEEAGMTYETARWYLKVMFQKTGTSRQSELTARLAGDAAGYLLSPRGGGTAGGHLDRKRGGEGKRGGGSGNPGGGG